MYAVEIPVDIFLQPTRLRERNVSRIKTYTEEEEIALALALGRYRYGTDRRCGCAFAGLLA